MDNTARDFEARGEFWQPPKQGLREPPPARVTADTCADCGIEFVAGARFCHCCGARRGAQTRPWFRLARLLHFEVIRERLGLRLGSLVALVAGVVCTLAAVATGMIYSTTTVQDWQAVQVWRIQWLLAAVAAFLAGLLLKRSED